LISVPARVCWFVLAECMRYLRNESNRIEIVDDDGEVINERRRLELKRGNEQGRDMYGGSYSAARWRTLDDPSGAGGLKVLAGTSGVRSSLRGVGWVQGGIE